MKRINILIFIIISSNLLSQVTRNLYNAAGLKIGEETIKENSTIGDSVISRVTYQFIKPGDSGVITDGMLQTQKQEALISGTNIKTINETSILGFGNLSFGYPELLLKNITALQPINGNAITGVGFGTFTLGTGTSVPVQSLSNTNFITRRNRLTPQNSTSAATSIASYRETHNRWSSTGGYNYKLYFGYNNGITVGTARSFMGFALNSSTVPTDVDPSTLTNCVGVGFDGADNFIQIIYNDGSGVATKIPSNIVVPTINNNNIYYLNYICQPNGTSIAFTLQEISISTGAVISTFNHTAISNLPTNSTYMGNRFQSSCGGTACTPSFTLFGLYIEGAF